MVFEAQDAPEWMGLSYRHDSPSKVVPAMMWP